MPQVGCAALCSGPARRPRRGGLAELFDAVGSVDRGADRDAMPQVIRPVGANRWYKTGTRRRRGQGVSSARSFTNF
ncbi:hypothetical protein T492DRAFT_968017 [Pavlovales sp. CCMP2436]|nr:hypothetical protein T492DRAFT_968017 [Pavlovales sp. CCMP2436]